MHEPFTNANEYNMAPDKSGCQLTVKLYTYEIAKN